MDNMFTITYSDDSGVVTEFSQKKAPGAVVDIGADVIQNDDWGTRLEI